MAKQRRTAGEKAAGDAIRQEAASGRHQPDKAKFARVAKMTKAAVSSPRFLSRVKSPDGIWIKRFRVPHEFVIGTLGNPRVQECGETTFPLELDSGRVILLPGNKMLQQQIKQAECLFQRVKITYLGKRKTVGGHFQKVYKLESAPLGKDGLGEAGRQTIANVAQKVGK